MCVRRRMATAQQQYPHYFYYNKSNLSTSRDDHAYTKCGAALFLSNFASIKMIARYSLIRTFTHASWWFINNAGQKRPIKTILIVFMSVCGVFAKHINTSYIYIRVHFIYEDVGAIKLLLHSFFLNIWHSNMKLYYAVYIIIIEFR